MIKLCKYLALGSIVMMCSCSTTGDPTQGGLWGWSEQKSIQRVETLRAYEAASQAQYDAAVKQRNSLQTQLTKAKQEARAAQQAAQKAKSAIPAATGNQVDSLERDVKLLEVR